MLRNPQTTRHTKVSCFDESIIIKLHIHCHTTASWSVSVSPVKKIKTKIPVTSLEAQLGTWKLNRCITFFICIPTLIKDLQVMLLHKHYFLQWISTWMQ